MIGGDDDGCVADTGGLVAGESTVNSMQIKMAMDMEMDMEPEAVKVSQVSTDIHGDIKSAPHPTHPQKHRQRGRKQPSQNPQNPTLVTTRLRPIERAGAIEPVAPD